MPTLGGSSLRSSPPRVGTGNGSPAPDPEVVPKPVRRRFSAAYRLRILEEADKCVQPGEVGKLLRREGLHSSHLATWRKARKQASLLALASKKPGVKAARSNPYRAQLLDLEGENARLKKQPEAANAKLDVAQVIMDAQGKVSRLLGLGPSNGKSA